MTTRRSIVFRMIGGCAAVALLLAATYYYMYVQSFFRIARNVMSDKMEIVHSMALLHQLNLVYGIDLDTIDLSDTTKASYRELKYIINCKLTENEFKLIRDASSVKRYLDLFCYNYNRLPVSIVELAHHFDLPDSQFVDSYGNKYFFKTFNGYAYIGSKKPGTNWTVGKTELIKILKGCAPLVYRNKNEMLVKLVPRKLKADKP